MVNNTELIAKAHEAINAAKAAATNDASTHALLAIASLLEAIEAQLGEVASQIHDITWAPKGD